MLGFGGQVDAV
jgi:hypothetical protein